MVYWWRKIAFPVRKAIVSVASRVKTRKNNGKQIADDGLTKLHNDIQTCGYEDVQVMWEILRKSEMELETMSPTKRRRRFWRVFVFSSSSDHHKGHNSPAAATTMI